MSGALPPNFISNTTTDIEDTDDIDPELTNSQILHRFWKVHAIQSDVVQDAASTRSRNLFWRVWSSPSLAESITSERLNTLWQQFSQNVDLSPIHIDPSFWQKAKNRNEENDPVAPHGNDKINFIDSFHPMSNRISRNGAFSQQNESPWSTSNNTSESSTRPLPRRSSGSKGKLPVASSSGKAKARPPISRSKSSQTKFQAPSTTRSPRIGSRSSRRGSVQDILGEESSGKAPSITAPPAKAKPAFSMAAGSSWEDDSSSEKPSAQASLQDRSASLVDRDFRGRFVESQKQMGSATNLASLARIRKTGSIVRFADQDPEDLRKGKEKDQLSPVQDEHGGVLEKTISNVSQAISDDSDSDSGSDEMQIPRNQSSLSLMIKDARKHSGNQNLGPSSLRQENQERGRETRKKEEELLKMGRKAGAPAAHKLSSESGYRYRSPSPGAQF